MGLGNPIIGDKREGWLEAQEFQTVNISSDVKIECLSVGWISLMGSQIGFELETSMDRMITHQVPIKRINHYEINDLPDPTHKRSGIAHHTSIENALQVSNSLQTRIPEVISVASIEAQKMAEFTNNQIPAVATIIRGAKEIILDLLIEYYSENPPIKECLIDKEKHL